MMNRLDQATINSIVPAGQGFWAAGFIASLRLTPPGLACHLFETSWSVENKPKASLHVV